MDKKEAVSELKRPVKEQVAQWAMITHLGASIMFEKIIIYDGQWLLALN